MMRILMMALLLLCGVTSSAQNFTLLKDINTSSNGSSADNYIAGPGGLTFFTAELPNSMGRKLFKTDGTTSGTAQLGAASVDRIDMLFLNGLLYFSRAGTLWATDGTEAGTYQVKITGTIPTGVIHLTASNGKIIFIANTGTEGQEPWVSDGTDAGTFLLKDIYPGTTGSNNPGYGSYYPKDVNGVVFFTARDNTANGFELWKTDGTTAGTVFVKNINTVANASSNIRELTAMGSILYFTADNGTIGEELWKSDGTNAGTVLVRDIIAGAGSSFVSSLTVKGTELFFHMGSGVNAGLWKTTGTSASTVAVKTGIYPYGAMINVNGALYFGASMAGIGVEIFKSDGTTAGTGLLKDISTNTTDSYPELLTNVNGTLFFVARQESFNDREVWKSDGTAAGTVMVKNLQPIFGGGSSPYDLTASNNKLFFTPSSPGDYSGSEPWVSDGTSAGTIQLKDINNYTQYSTNEQNSLLVGNELFFPVNSNIGNRICKTDGTEAGTIVLTTADLLNPDYTARVQYQTPLVHANGKLFFLASRQGSFSDTEIFTSDGTPAGTALLKDIDNNEYASSQPAYLTKVGNLVYFAATNAAAGRELWKSDGTAAGTVMVKDIYSGSSNSGPTGLTEMNGLVYFAANGNDGAGAELWKSDGTVAGTVRVKDIYAGANGGFPRNMVVLNGRLYFVASTAANGSELWTSDGTDAGTYEVKDIYSGGQSSDPTDLILWNNKIVFTAYTNANGREIWISDGTNIGTYLLVDVIPGATSSNPIKLVAGTDKFYFVGNNGVNGSELWVSDGTSAGSFMVKDIRTGPNDGSIDKMIFVDGTLFFSAYDGSTGVELWRSSGTAGTTNQVVDFWPGAQGGIGIIAKLPNQLMVGFNSAEYSYEPWVALLQGVLPVRLLQFDGQLQQKDAKLFWKTTNEQNLAYYEIQRSKDGVNFTGIGNQSPRNIAGTHQYNFTDYGIAERETGIVYYRLKQVDADGSESFSKIVPIVINTKGPATLLFPNPAHDKTQLILKGKSGDLYNARLIDMNGKTLQQWHFKMQGNSQLVDLDLKNILPGSYTIELVNAQKVENLMLIKY